MDQQGLATVKQISELVESAYQQIQSYILHTPLIVDPATGLYLKCENEQITGSFKLRGALSKLSKLAKGTDVVTASTGNHGLGVSKAAEIFGIKVQVFIPINAAGRKKEKLIHLGVDVVQVEGDSLDAELAGKAYAAKHSSTWVSPYNDMDVIAGQGTIGLEITRQLPAVKHVYITVGGGGLIAGIGSWMKTIDPAITIIACQPENSPEMYLSQQAGRVITAPDAKPTLSDGSAGPLEEDSITYDLCRQIIDRFILVTETEIKSAISYLFDTHGITVEGAAGVALAAAIKDQDRKPGEESVVVLCGGNIDPVIHREICGG